MTNPNDKIQVVIAPDENGDTRYYDGLTKREFFSSAMMSGMFAGRGSAINDECIKNYGVYAVQAADALIAALNQSEDKQ